MSTLARDIHKFTVLNGGRVIIPVAVAVPLEAGGNVCRSVVVAAALANTQTVRVGGSTLTPVANGVELAAGDSISIDIDSTGKVFVVDTTASGTQIVDFLFEV